MNRTLSAPWAAPRRTSASVLPVRRHHGQHHDRNADAHQRINVWVAGADEIGEIREVVGDLVDRGVALRTVHPHQLEHVSADPDERDGERVDGDLEGQHGGVLGVGSDERRRAAGRPERSGPLLRDQAGRDELDDEPTDRAPGEAGPGDKLRARERSTLVQLADDRAEVRPPDRLAALAKLKHEGLCSSLPNASARLLHGSGGVKPRVQLTVPGGAEAGR